MIYKPFDRLLVLAGLPGYAATAATGWHPAINSADDAAKSRMKFAPKGAAAVVQRYRPAVALTPVLPANCSGYRYMVDMGRELQGGIQLSINGESRMPSATSCTVW